MAQVLIACEQSGTVRDEFTRLGHTAFSCDILPSDTPGLHIQCDIRKVNPDGWDLLIAFPPCTHLAVSGASYFHRKQKEQAEALALVQWLLDFPCPRIALENPVSIISSRIRKPTQIIHPWQFGHAESKTTCLWLTDNLPPLVPTKIIEPEYICACGQWFELSLGKYGCPNCAGEYIAKQRYRNQNYHGQNAVKSNADRAKIRSKTYLGIAKAMAEQWGPLLPCE